MQFASAGSTLRSIAQWGFAVFALALAIFSVKPITQNLIIYHEEWGPALALACMGRMGDLDFKNVPAEQASLAREKVAAFLNRKPVQTFACTDLPSATTVAPLSEASNHRRFFVRHQVGLMATVGVLWGTFGPDWRWLGFVSALLASATILALYAVARKFVGRTLSVVLAAMAGFHPEFTSMIPQTRDFGKAFFAILSFFVLLGLVLNDQTSRRNYILSAAALGAFLGFGVGFRQDAIGLALVAFVLLTLFPPRGIDGGRMALAKTQVVGLAAFASAMLAFVVPLYWFVPVDHAHEGHFLILGLIDMAFKNAGTLPADFLFNPSYEDYSGYTLITAHSMAETGTQDIEVFSRQYNEGSRRQFLEVAATFPFIIFGRIYAVFWDVMTSASLVASHWGVQMAFGVASVAALIIALSKSPRLAVFLLLYLLASAAMLSLQYVQRHYFHLHFLWLVISLAIVMSSLSRFRGVNVGSWSSPPTGVGETKSVADSNGMTRAAASIYRHSLLDMRFAYIVAAGILLLPLTSYIAENVTRARWTQKVAQSKFVAAPTAAPRKVGENAEGKVFVELKVDGEHTLTNFAGLSEPFSSAFQRKYRNLTGGFLRARFRPSTDCQGPANLRIVYEAKYSFANMSHSARPHGADGAGDYYFPAFFVDESRFAGVEFESTHAKCFEGLSWSQEFRAIRLPVEFWSSNVPKK